MVNISRTGQLLRKNFRFLLEAFFWVVVVRLGLTCSSYSVLRTQFARTVDQPSVSEVNDAARLAWAVHHAARLVPAATCLTQALACQIILSRRSISSTLHIGAIRSPSTKFSAHAWLTQGGKVLLGGTQQSLEAYSRLAEYRT